ncbi:MAG: sporulation protein YqfD, partial [Clostridiales bacterium]|nr:sporulation protein YqfD [Clostridiales bacterium]
MRLKVRGILAFRFLNLLAREGIYIWDITCEGEYIGFYIGSKNKEKAKELGVKTGCRVEIVSAKGFPEFLKNLKKDIFFTAGAVFFSLFLLMSTRRIWLIEVKGNYRINTGEILEFCSRNNLDYGTKKSELDTNRIEREIKNNFQDISFASITVSGTRALITVSETLPLPEEKNYMALGNITACENAVITDITVSSGTPVVKEGMSVAAGDLLISGEVFLKAEQEVLGSYMTAAEGKVYGKAVESYNFTIPFKEKYKIYS